MTTKSFTGNQWTSRLSSSPAVEETVFILTPRKPLDSVRTLPGPWWLFTTRAHCPASATPLGLLAVTAAQKAGSARAGPMSLGGSVPAVRWATTDSHTASHAAVASASVRRQQGRASARPARSGPSVTCARHTPSASTPWLAAKAATVPGWAPMGLPARSATGTTGSADASSGSQGDSVTDVLLAFIASLNASPAAATEMGPSRGSVTQRPVLVSARKMWKVQNVMPVGKAHSTWTQRIPRVVPVAFVLE